MRPDWAECFKFSFVRNPWDRAVSLFFHQNKFGDFDGNDFKKWLFDMVEENGYPRDRVDNWQVTDAMEGTGGTPMPWKNQSDWLVDFSHNICMDFIGRFETLEEDTQTVSNLIGIDLILPHLRQTDRDFYKNYYIDEDCINLVAEWHQKDIENFGYSF